MREFSAGTGGVGSPARVRGGYGAFTRVRNGFCKDTPSEASMAQHDSVGSEGLLLADCIERVGVQTGWDTDEARLVEVGSAARRLSTAIVRTKGKQ